MIRLFLPVPNIWPAGPIFDWSLDYAKAFSDIENVRAISYTNGDFSNKKSPWYDLGHMFIAPMSNLKINIVLAPAGGFFKKAWTENLFNIAIVNPNVANYWHELNDFKQYNMIWTNYDFCSLDYFYGNTRFVPATNTVVKEQIERLAS